LSRSERCVPPVVRRQANLDLELVVASRPPRRLIHLTVAHQARLQTTSKETKETKEIVEDEPMEPLQGVVELEPASQWSRGA